jgi:SPP1 gp7 family putative phage head morphogenesis protein
VGRFVNTPLALAHNGHVAPVLAYADGDGRVTPATRLDTTQHAISALSDGYGAVLAYADAAGRVFAPRELLPNPVVPTEASHIPRPLYVHRPVLNADQIITWAKSVGFTTTLPAEDMHVTICYSNKPVDWLALDHMADTLEVPPEGVRTLAWDESKHPRNPKGSDKGGEFAPAFHGTSSEFVESIKRKGLIGKFDMWNPKTKTYGKGVWLTTRRKEAEYFAKAAGKYSDFKPVIVTVHVPKAEWSKFATNESSVEFKFGKIPPEWIKEVRGLDGKKYSAEDYVKLFGVVLVPLKHEQYADRSIIQLGSEGAVVLQFESAPLSARHQYFLDQGASWDYDGYYPHITLTYDAPAGLDLSTVEPYNGPIVLGPEEFEEVQGGWADGVKEHAQVPTEIDYAQIKRDLDALEAKFRDELRDLLTQSRNVLLATVRRRGGQLDKLALELKLPYERDIQRAIRDAMQRAMDRGGADAAREVGRVKKYAEEDGVWRTIRGRRVFIREGESVDDALKRSLEKGLDKIGVLPNTTKDVNGKMVTVYHGTTASVIKNIMKEGVRGPAYVTQSRKLAEVYTHRHKDRGQKSALLTIQMTKEQFSTFKKAYGSEFYSQKPIPASWISNVTTFIENDLVTAYTVILIEPDLTISQHSYAAPPTFIPTSAVKWLRIKSFWVSGVLNTGLTEDARLAIINGLKTGKPNSEIITDVARAYIPYLGDPTAVERGELPTAARLETVVRTNITEAYNKGRLDQYVKPSLMPFLDGIQYSAILDSRTTEVCRFLHHKIFKPTDPELDSLTPPNHFNCLIDGQVRVFSSKGWVPIRDISVGDLVLTHQGKFKPVTYVHHKQNPQKYFGDVVRLSVQIQRRKPFVFTVTFTPDHPVLTTVGWIPASKITRQHQVKVMGLKCDSCDKLLPLVHSFGINEQTRCGSCSAKHGWNEERSIHQSKLSKKQMKREYADGTRDRTTIALAANARHRELVRTGQYVVSDEGVARQAQGRINSKKWRRSVTVLRRGKLNPMSLHPEIAKRNGDRLVERWRKDPKLHPNYTMANISKPQMKLFAVAQELFPEAELNTPVQTENSVRFVDVGLSVQRVGLEYDGSHWHKNSVKDLRRDLELNAAGWSILHYRDRVPTKVQLRRDVARLLANHDGDYGQIEAKIVKVECWKLRKARRLFNFSVQDDESYVVKGLISHNCRSLLVPLVVGTPYDKKDFITPSEIEYARSLADAKFLEQEEEVHEHDADGVWRTIRGRRVFIREGETPGEAIKRSITERTSRALESHKPATKEKQQKAAKYEATVAKLINGKNLDDHEPFDVIKGRHAVEVKAIIEGKNPKVTMHPDALARKANFLRDERMTGHTVVIDARGDKPVYHYKAGVGSFRLSSMQVVKGSELRGLIQ